MVAFWVQYEELMFGVVAYHFKQYGEVHVPFCLAQVAGFFHIDQLFWCFVPLVSGIGARLSVGWEIHFVSG
jgi:hypothetical protein